MKRVLLYYLVAIIIILNPSFSNTSFGQTDTVGIKVGRTPLVKIVTIDAPITPVTERIFKRAIDKSEEDLAGALIIELNTPGGLDTSMRDIIKRILRSKVPIIVYIAPSGSRCASAGVFITMASNIAAMAPGTNIGAAHPVNIGGKMDSTMTEKVANDAAAYIRSLAEKRGRNAKWAVDAVYKSVSITETEALKKNVIDIIARNVGDLLNQCDGRKVSIDDTTVVLHTKDARLERIEITISDKILKIISDPNVAYLLMSIGMMGLYFEFSNPGAILPGVVGAICLILAFFSFSTLPINYAGLLLIMAAIIMFILEIKIPSHGALTIGGIISMLIGSMMLINTDVPYMRISMILIITVVLATAAFFVFAVGFALKAQKRKVQTGIEGMIGKTAMVFKDFENGRGQITLHGEIWRAESNQNLKKGDMVRVMKINNLTAEVEKI